MDKKICNKNNKLTLQDIINLKTSKRTLKIHKIKYIITEKVHINFSSFLMVFVVDI